MYDAFSKSPALIKDWGYSALVEYDGKRILFDTSNNSEVFRQNASALGVDLKRIDIVVISHRHGDHTGGLNHLLSVNPGAKIYVPRESFGVFGASLPGTFYRKDESLPSEMRYFSGHAPETMIFGSPWRANFVWVDQTTEVAPGIHVVPSVSEKPGTLELRELSLAVRTQRGLVLVVGCSHPGIQKIMEATRPIENHIHLIAGGLHLVTASDAEVSGTAAMLRDQWKVDRIAVGHCTGEPAFAALQRAFGDQYVYAGLGSEIKLD